MKLSRTLDLVLTSKERALSPFWTMQSKEISEKLWLPIKIDSVDSVLSSSKELSINNPMGKSWFSIKKKHPQMKNSLMTSFQSSQFSLPDCMDSEVVSLKTKSKAKLKTQKTTINKTKEKQEKKTKETPKKLKTIKFRLFPNDEQKKNYIYNLNNFVGIIIQY